mgnify:CR=1 FL=1
MIRQQGGRGDALIEVLHQVQELEGYLSPAALRKVASGLSLPLSRVQGVASFYHLFRLEAPTPHRCAVCLGTACFVQGGADLARALERHLGVRLDDAAGDGTWALQHVSCLGACGQAPPSARFRCSAARRVWPGVAPSRVFSSCRHSGVTRSARGASSRVPCSRCRRSASC